MNRHLPPQRGGFVLLEAMVAVMIFAIGIVALGRCVENCMRAELAQVSDANARRVLENRMREIQVGAIALKESNTEDLKGPFAGMKLTTKSRKEKFQNEKEINFEIEVVELEVLWEVDGRENSRTLDFYVLPRK
jgi:Tfp pilus assembly protein PilV